MLNTENTHNYAAAASDTDVNIVGYGNYYNWYSATAGHGTYDLDTNNTSVSGSICPIGWHLPVGGNKANVASSEFWRLSRAIIGSNPANFANNTFFYTDVRNTEGTNASKAIRSWPNNFVYPGYWDGTIADFRGNYGHYWSSTISSTYSAYILYSYYTIVYPGTQTANKKLGQPIRCVAD